MSPDTLALVALAAVAFIVFVATLVVWVWRRGWRPGEPPRE